MVMERMTKIIDGRLVFPSELVGVMMTPSNDTMCRILNRLAAYEDTGLEPEDVISAEDMAKIACALHELNAYKDLGSINHLRDLIQAEQDGRLVVLPCKVGDAVYFTLLGRIIEKPVFSIVSFSSSTRIYCAGTSEFFRPEDICKTVFLTREEAEAALAGKGGEG